MSRDLSAGVLAEIGGQVVRPVFLCAIGTTAGTSYFWTGHGNLVHGGNVYAGTGLLAGISTITETADLEASGVQLSLSGIDPAVISYALNYLRQGYPCTIHLAFLDASMAVIADPVPIWEGFVDVPEISDDAETATLMVSSESRLVDLERPRARRYTDQDQKIDVPLDSGFEFVPGLQDKQIVWGR